MLFSDVNKWQRSIVVAGMVVRINCTRTGADGVCLANGVA